MIGATQLELDKYIVSGKKIQKGFGYLESQDGKIDFSIIHDLITKGDSQGKVMYVIRNCIPKNWAQRLSDNFTHVIEQRGSHRLNDGFVSVQQIGASQFAKNGFMYTQESHKVFNDLEKMFYNIPVNVVDNLFLEKLLQEKFLEYKIHFGPSRFKHGYACMATFRKWLDNGVMSLMPHEDKAQLAFAAKDNFEISKASIVVAQNICLQSSGEGGELTVWNIQPDENCRRSFDVLETGYPYPPEYIRHIEKIEVKLNAGDMYFMNGCCLHGVKNVVNGDRLTAGRFIGYVPNNKVVYWT